LDTWDAPAFEPAIVGQEQIYPCLGGTSQLDRVGSANRPVGSNSGVMFSAPDRKWQDLNSRRT
jgi:hypothetical protein